MNLPIDVIPDTSPPRFRWRQTVSTPLGDRVVDHEGELPSTVEEAVIILIAITKQQAQEIIGLRRIVEDPKLLPSPAQHISSPRRARGK